MVPYLEDNTNWTRTYIYDTEAEDAQYAVIDIASRGYVQEELKALMRQAQRERQRELARERRRETAAIRRRDQWPERRRLVLRVNPHLMMTPRGANRSLPKEAVSQ